MRPSELYDGIVDKYSIPALVSRKERDEVCKYLDSLSQSEKNAIELYVRRLQDKNKWIYPTVYVLTLSQCYNRESLYVGSGIFLPVEYLNLKELLKL